MAQEIQVVPDRWAPQGEAVAVRGGKQLLVWNGIPGEPALVRVDYPGRNRDAGFWLSSPSPSPHRVEPPCDRYHPCGGCPFMHLDAAGQVRAHRAMVRQALDAEGLGQVKIGAFHDCPDGAADFRHVVKLGFGWSDQGRVKVGSWGRRNRRVVPIPNCTVAAPILRKVMAAVAHHTIELRIRPYDPVNDSGVLRSAVLRASRTTGEVMVTLVAGRRVRELSELAEQIASVSEVVGVWVHFNSSEGNAIFERDEEGLIPVRPLLGKGFIEERLGNVTYRIGPTDFFQTNPSTAAVLYQRTLSRLQLEPEVPFVDLYCGVGGLALQAAPITGWAVGVEEGLGAVANAREVARREGLSAEFLGGRVEDILPDLARRLEGAHPVVSVNPARRGLENGVIDQVLALSPRRIAYVSCNPRALAADLAAFDRAGYAPGEVELFDMFPNTAHVESVTILEPKQAPKIERRAPRRKVVR